MKIIGVDLGTTNSCVYYLNESGDPVLAVDARGRKFFPSVVWCAGPGKDVEVGHTAKSRVGRMPPPVVAVKRKMGTTETVKLGGVEVTAVEVSAKILGYARKLVEEATRDSIGGVVVTMPAYFGAAPKRDTYDAAVQAFFGGDAAAAKGRLELQLEPEAAAYAYTSEDPAETLRILVYDLGGGTFDVTVLEKTPGAGLSVLKFGGDPHLGGDDIDDRIGTWILYVTQGGKPETLDRILDPKRYDPSKRYTILQRVLRNDEKGLRGELLPEDRGLLLGSSTRFALELNASRPEDLLRIQVLKNLAEAAKKDLTESTEAVIAKQGAFQDQNDETVDIDLTLNRADFNRLIGDFVERSIAATQRVQVESGLQPGQIDRILMVGGSTRMPIVREELQKVFDRPILMKEPDLIVARGAALRARDLNPPPLGLGAGTAPMTLEYPRHTADSVVAVQGRLARPVRGYHVYLSRAGREIADIAVVGDRFRLKDIKLAADSENKFQVEVVDENEKSFATEGIVIRHSRSGPSEKLGVKITKPIFSPGVKGGKVLFEEGTELPAQNKLVCYRATKDDFILIEFYEGEDPLAQLHLTGVDPSLHLNAEIDVEIKLNENFQVEASAVVRETGQKQKAVFDIPRIEVPPIETMDRALTEVLEQIAEEALKLRDPNVRAAVNRKARALENEYEAARKTLELDRHHLSSVIGKLRGVLTEARNAQAALRPTFEEFQRQAARCRGLAQGLTPGSGIRKEDVLERITALERAGKDVYDREDAPEWRRITDAAESLEKELNGTLAENHSPTEYTPQQLQQGCLEWLNEIRSKARKFGLDGQIATECDAIERDVRACTVHGDAQVARRRFLEIIENRLRPLDGNVDQLIKAKGQEPPRKQGTTVSW
jgi:molecular chaperone DnaK (HSP70)